MNLFYAKKEKVRSQGVKLDSSHDIDRTETDFKTGINKIFEKGGKMTSKMVLKRCQANWTLEQISSG